MGDSLDAATRYASINAALGSIDLNKLIEDVLRTPGLYCYECDAWAFFFEVDAAGVVHQLKPHTMERDGVLSLEGWREPSDADRVRRVWPREDEASWRAAVDEMLTVCGGVASDDPRESINRLIDWHVQVALDPTVSSEAKELVDIGKAAQWACDQAAYQAMKARIEQFEAERSAP